MTRKWWPVSNDQLVGRIRLRSLSFARPMHLSQANTLGASFGEETMRAKLQDVIYPGNPAGTWEMYNNKVENEYTTIIVKRGQDLKQRARGSREEFVGKTWASVLALWCLGLFCALSAFSQTTVASGLFAPTVSFTVPANGSTGVAINEKIAVTFSEAMDPSTITRATFTLMRRSNEEGEDEGEEVAGTVKYSGVTATF